MNSKLNKAILDIGKAADVAHSIEAAFETVEFTPETLSNANHLINAFYALEDQIRKIGEDIDDLVSDSEIVDVILTIRNR